MESLRWIRVAPFAIMLLAGSVGSDGPVIAAVGDPPWDPPPCDGAGTGNAASTGAWYRLDPFLDQTGTLSAQHLEVGAIGSPPRRMELAPESFASGPVGGLVLVGDDDGTQSRLRLVDPARDCATVLVGEEDVIRSAVMTADGLTAYEHRVDRASRADLGIWRRELGAIAGSGRSATTRILDGLAPDPERGPTFATDLVLSPDGRLVVSSCAERTCRVRVHDAASGRSGGPPLVDDVGPAIGIAGGRLIARAACPGQPCDVLAIDLSNGRRTTLVAAAGPATLGGSDGTAIVYAAPDGRVSVVDALTGRRSATAAVAGLPLRTGSTATSGMETPPGIVAIGRDGRPGGQLLGLDPERGVTVSIGEVRP